MAHLIHGSRCLVELCAAIGLEGKPVRKIVIEAEVNAAVMITATLFMQLGEHNEMCEVIKRYRIEELKPENTEPPSSPGAPGFREFT